MSFSNFEDIEASAADASSVHYKDFPEFETVSLKIESCLYNINNNQLVSLKNLTGQYDNLLKGSDPAKAEALNKLGYKVTALTEKITANYKLVNELTLDLNLFLNKCEENHEDEDALGYLRQKESLLIKLIKSSLKNYQNLHKKYKLLQQKTVDDYKDESANTLEDGNTPGNTASVQVGSQVEQVQITYEPVNAEELEAQTLLIQEREREIEQISQDITYINEIYGNLENIVHEQQFTIDSIEDNILRYSDDVRGASLELRKAERYQRRSGGRMFCCLMILLGILGVIVLVGVIF